MRHDKLTRMVMFLSAFSLIPMMMWNSNEEIHAQSLQIEEGHPQAKWLRSRNDKLQVFLNEGSSLEQRKGAVAALKNSYSDTGKRLLEFASDSTKDPELRWQALRAHRATDTVIPVMLQILREETSGGKSLRAKILPYLRQHFRPPVDAKLRMEVYQVVQGLLTDQDPDVRREAFWIMGPKKDALALELLAGGLNRPDQALISTTQALTILNFTGPEKYTEVVRPYLRDSDTKIKSLAIRCLRSDQASRAEIVRILRDTQGNNEVRTAAIESLSDDPQHFPSDVFPVIENANDDPVIRSKAMQSVVGLLNYKSQEIHEADQIKFADLVNRLSAPQPPMADEPQDDAVGGFSMRPATGTLQSAAQKIRGNMIKRNPIVRDHYKHPK